MLDYVSLASVIFLSTNLSFFCGTLLQYVISLVLIVIIFFRLINHNNRIETSAWINYIAFATFTAVLNN